MTVMIGRAQVPRPYSSVNLTPEALDRLRRVTFVVQAAIGRRVPLSDAVTALAVLADRHPEELVEIVRNPEGTDAS
jgi:DNA-binding IclR family transcriptional regulator